MPVTRRRQAVAAGVDNVAVPHFTIPPLPPAPPPVAAKRNAVDVISSRISYDTVIPVDILHNTAAFLAKCKPYDIIEGRSPFSDERMATASSIGVASSPTSLATTTGKRMRVELAAHAESLRPSATTSGGGGGGRRKRSSSPAIAANHRRGEASASSERSPETTAESTGLPLADPEHFVSTVTPSPLLARGDQMPTIHGWAGTRLSESTPYQLQTSKDAETRVKYILDDEDYDWCSERNVSPEVLQRSFTFFEWAYVSFLLNMAQGEGITPSTFSPTKLVAAISNSRDGSKASASSFTSGSSGASPASKSATLRSFLTQATKLNVTLCALCVKPVHVITATDRTRIHELQATESLGVKCNGCDVIAHLQCWYLPSLPANTEHWLCDGCYLCELHRRRAAFSRCVVCGRDGGVLLPYRARDSNAGGIASAASSSFAAAASCVSSAASVFHPTQTGDKDSRDGVSVNSDDGKLRGVRSPSSPTGSSSESGVCHAVCALAFPELIIRLQPSTGLTCPGDLGQQRPCVVPTRRIPRQISSCIYCEGAACPTVQCQHPRCYECMHPSCAAEQHTLECFTLDEATNVSSGASTAASAPVAATRRAIENGEDGSSLRGTRAATAAENVAAMALPWTGASVYCRKHFGYNINRTLGSAALAEKAEGHALKMNLHSLLSGLRMTYREEEVGESGGGFSGSGSERRGRSRTDSSAIMTRSGRGCGVGSGGSSNSSMALATLSPTRTPSPGSITSNVSNEAFFLHGTLPVAKAVRRGPGRPSAAELRQRAAEAQVITCVRRYWQQKRSDKRRQSATLAAEINIVRTKPILAAALRPELIKISATKVRLSHFLCLIPEWQQMLVALVEGELPLADEEYDDVQRYRKASTHTRRSGNTAELYQRMAAAHDSLVTFADCSGLVRQQAATRAKLVEAELRWCDTIANWPPP